ncbi:MAG: DUF1611 domain-containing protein [Propionibacteriaceae bacterium]|nr:DUF1611 domain-containing protein [Propionibacteriaceae bacterium]
MAVVERLGHHTRLELPSGRKATLHIGDEIIVAYADRYAPDQYEANVPINLGITQLVASGGVASHVLSRHESLRLATRIRPVGLIADERGMALNLRDFALAPSPVAHTRPRTIAVVGTSMNSGKTTTNRYLVNGLNRGGHRPGATKVTGTGSGGDYWIIKDAGAHMMLDFTDVGFASTYRMPMFAIERAYIELLDHLTYANCGVLLVEVADGIYQKETAKLIDSAPFRESVDGVIFAAGDAMGAAHGVETLQRMGLPVIAVAGRLTASPLALREARQACAVPVLTSYQLRDPEEAAQIVGLSRKVDASDDEDRGRPALSIVDSVLASTGS